MLTFEQQALHLQKVSLTFALTIPLLPMPLADWVGNAYLLCRIVDTIEDDAHLTTASKKQHIEAYLAGKPDHKMDNEKMVDHIVELVEAKAAELAKAEQAALQAAE